MLPREIRQKHWTASELLRKGFLMLLFFSVWQGRPTSRDRTGKLTALTSKARECQKRSLHQDSTRKRLGARNYPKPIRSSKSWHAVNFYGVCTESPRSPRYWILVLLQLSFANTSRIATQNEWVGCCNKSVVMGKLGLTSAGWVTAMDHRV